MSERLRRLWRTCCGAVGFTLFGLLATGLTWLVLPLDRRLRPRGADLRAQRMLHRTARFYLRGVEALSIARVRVRDAKRLRSTKGRVIVANHPTLFDVILLCALLPQMDCVVSPAWARNPFLRGLVDGAGYVRGDGSLPVVRECSRRLAGGRSLLIFPEGTRSPRDGLGPFHRGAAYLALRAGAPLLPILIRCQPPIQTKGQKWYDLAASRVEVTIRVGTEISRDAGSGNGRGLAEASRGLTRELRETLVKELELVDAGT
jgi:1-acyl-sn-glycerol-3-phosphate acyltransferase